jgi:hypothetical protein
MPGFQDLLTTGASFVSRALTPLASPIMTRLASSGLLPGGGRSSMLNSGGTNVNFVNGASGTSARDWKVKISVSPNSGIFYHADSGVLDPLRQTNGVVFPYTPQITVTYQANYAPQRFAHSNYSHFSYENSEVQQINLQAEFTAQNQQEASYVLACIYFFRAATKMFFANSPNSGSPPPLVFLDGYGDQYFKRVPCLVTAFSHTMPNDVDYIDTANTSRALATPAVDIGDGSFTDVQSVAATKIPTISSFQIALQPVYSKENLTKFNLQDFAQGKLVTGGFI